MPLTSPGVKLISVGTGDLYLKSNYQNFQRFLAVDLAIAGDGELSLPVLTGLIREQLSSPQRGKIEQRKAVLQKTFNEMREFNRKAASLAWNARPISTARLCMELWQQIKDHDWSLVSDTFFQSFWPQRLWISINTINLWGVRRVWCGLRGAGGGRLCAGQP